MTDHKIIQRLITRDLSAMTPSKSTPIYGDEYNINKQ